MRQNSLAKRLTVLLLAVLLLLSVFVGCVSDNPSGGETTDAVTGTPADDTETGELTDGLPEKSMDGFTLSILNWDETELTWANTRLDYDSVTETEDRVSQAIYYRNRAVEERFDCFLDITEVPNVSNQMKTLVPGGDTTYDIFMISDMYVLVSVPNAAPWDDVPYINREADWWYPAANGVYNFYGKQMALAGGFSLGPVSREVMLIFNKDIAGDKLRDVNLYDLVRNNEWTLEKFFEYGMTVAGDNGDNIWNENDLYAYEMGRGAKGYILSLLSSSNVQLTSYDEDTHEQYFSLHENEKGLDLLADLVEYFNEDGFSYNTNATEDTYSHPIFSTQNALFSAVVPHEASRFWNYNFDYGFLPLPMYDEAQAEVGYISPSWSSAQSMLNPIIDLENRAENIGIIFEALAFETWHKVIPEYQETMLKVRTTQDTESMEMLDIIFRSVTYNFGINLIFDGMYGFAGKVCRPLWQSKDASRVLSTVVAQQSAIQGGIDGIYEGLADLEGLS